LFWLLGLFFPSFILFFLAKIKNPRKTKKKTKFENFGFLGVVFFPLVFLPLLNYFSSLALVLHHATYYQPTIHHTFSTINIIRSQESNPLLRN